MQSLSFNPLSTRCVRQLQLLTDTFPLEKFQSAFNAMCPPTRRCSTDFSEGMVSIRFQRDVSANRKCPFYEPVLGVSIRFQRDVSANVRTIFHGELPH